MASKQTKNYGLNQWERTDKVIMEDFNADNAAIDAALGQKAEASVVTALQATVAKKAEQSALTALQATVNGKASQTALDALQSTVNGKGNCSVTFGTYVGTGAETVTIKTGFAPKVVIIMGSKFGISVRGHEYMEYFSSLHRVSYATWESDGLTLTRARVSDDSDWNNISGTTYYYVALG